MTTRRKESEDAAGPLQSLHNLVKATDVMQEVTKSLEEEPYRLFNTICRHYLKENQPVPDHQLHVSGWVGELALRALLAAGLVVIGKGERFPLCRYVPTEEGLKLYNGLTANKSPLP